MYRDRFIVSLTAAAVASMGLAPRAARAQSVLIKPKFPAGDTCYVDQTREIKQKIENSPMGGGTMEVETLQRYGLNRKFGSAPDGGATVMLTFDRVMQKLAMPPMIDGAFDTDNPDDEEENAMLAAPLKAILGGKFQITLGADGQVQDCTGMNEILERVQDAAPGNPLAMQFGQEFSNERGKLTFGEAYFLLYPNKEVKVGETWKKAHRDTLPRVAKVVTHYQYTLDRISEEAGRKVAVITYKSTMEKDPDARQDDEPGFFGEDPMIKGTGSGTAIYDIERGLVVKQVSDRHVTIEGGPPGGDKAKSKKEKGAPKNSDDDDANGDDDNDDGDEPAKPMKVNVDVKQTITVTSDAERAVQKAAAAASGEAKAKKEAAKKPAEKKEARPSKKAEKDDDEDDD